MLDYDGKAQGQVMESINVAASCDYYYYCVVECLSCVGQFGESSLPNFDHVKGYPRYPSTLTKTKYNYVLHGGLFYTGGLLSKFLSGTVLID